MSEFIFKAKCQICGEIYALIDIREIKTPIDGSMFHSIDPDRGYDPPFFPDFEWPDMRCPYGPHQPMILPDRIMIEDLGMLNVPVEGMPYFTSVGPERDYIYDRDYIPVAPGLPREEKVTDGKADTQQGQAEVQQSVEGEAKEVNSECPVNYCCACDKQFKNKAGFRNHMRIKHKITNPEDYETAK
jgi:hypothetical protein